MRSTQLFISTLRESPVEAEIVSHKLMLRAGLIRRLGSGLYTWMPLGLRVLRKVEAIVREEMNSAGAMEVLMPAVQPAELWQETGRWDVFGPQMLKIKDRHERDFCFGPTHEEVITDLMRREINSYRQLPVNFYQIQTKFRDEIRPRFGVMRAREFLMKDAYSFHASASCLEKTYNTMYEAYRRIFSRLGLRFRAVSADTGAIGGADSHEFHVLAESGEDWIAYSDDNNFAANMERAEALALIEERLPAQQVLTKVDTPSKTECEEVAQHLGLKIDQMVKCVVIANDNAEGNAEIYLAMIRGDHTLNEIKVSKILGIKNFRLATEAEILEVFGCKPGYLGPISTKKPVTLVVDLTVANMSDFVCGANEENVHFTGVNWGRDIAESSYIADIRNVVEGDRASQGLGKIKLCKGIEVGHVFALGTKYSEAMGATYLDEAGVSKPMEMGCYGIGVSRIVAAAIEQNCDENGIVWPLAMSPFDVAIVPIAYHREPLVKDVADHLYERLEEMGLDVMLEDRDERMGVVLSDLDLLGIPFRVTLGKRDLDKEQVEVYVRRTQKKETIRLEDLDDWFAMQAVEKH
ncbi:MAG: proline--tRNA ligase [Pseudomonadota bacterium]